MNSIYNGLYNIIVTYIYGAVQTGSYEDLCAVLMSSIGCILVASIPFVVAFLVIKMLFDVWTNFISGGF